MFHFFLVVFIFDVILLIAENLAFSSQACLEKAYAFRIQEK